MSISIANNITALSLLQFGQQSAFATTLLNSTSFSATSDAILKSLASAFSSSAKLQQQFSDALDKALKNGVASDGQKIHPDNARHNAMVDVILANRGDFPPEEFSIHNDLPDGASITTEIPSAAALKAAAFKAEVSQKQAAYDAAIDMSAAQVDPDVVKINAMSQVVKSLVLDSAEVGAENDTGSQALEILTRNYLSQA
ncbi:hypothetical protein [Rhizobium sp. Root1212]|uniref:hypothetical protein n=1 Tax=Rhizobium sp. Root1212 TaxID=1736429 RepID=UPI000B21D4DE|nr:hypothetical protein [Rhizobium sp. Root1212]